MADFLPGELERDNSLPCSVDLEDCFNLFGGKNKFWKKLAVYLKTISGFDSLRYGFESIDVNEDLDVFLTLEIREPVHYFKGVKLEDLLDFYNLNLPRRYRARSGGGGVGVKSDRREDGESLRLSASGFVGGGGGDR